MIRLVATVVAVKVTGIANQAVQTGMLAMPHPPTAGPCRSIYFTQAFPWPVFAVVVV